MVSKTILLIDESRDNSLLLQMLRQIVYNERQVIICHSMEEAINIGGNIDVVLIDLAEKASLLSFFRQQENKFSRLPLVVLIDPHHVGLAAETANAGVQDFLIKENFDERLLEKTIECAVEKKKFSNDYKHLFEESPVPMYVFDSDSFNMLAVNNAALDQYGYTRQEFLKMRAEDIRPAEDVAAFYNAVRKVPDTYFDAGKWRHKRKSGEIFYVHIFSCKMQFRGKSAKMNIAIDIDDNVKAKNSLKEKAVEIENILESITDGFYALNNNWEFTYVNRECERVLNVKREDILGKNVWDLYPEAKKLKFYPLYHQVMNEKVSVQFEEYYEPLNLWSLINAYPAKEGIVAYFVDITAKKKIQEKFFQEEQNLRAIINNTDDIIWSIDKNLNIISANDAFWKRVKRIAGKEPGEITAKDFEEQLFTTWKKFFNRGFKGENFKIIWEESYNDMLTYEEVSFNPIHDKKGGVSGLSCFSRDITAERNYQRKIEMQNEQLKKIAWILSHKVRAHLANIMNLAPLLNLDDYTDLINKEVVKNLNNSAFLLDAVIKEISDLTDRLAD